MKTTINDMNIEGTPEEINAFLQLQQKRNNSSLPQEKTPEKEQPTKIIPQIKTRIRKPYTGQKLEEARHRMKLAREKLAIIKKKNKEEQHNKKTTIQTVPNFVKISVQEKQDGPLTLNSIGTEYELYFTERIKHLIEHEDRLTFLYDGRLLGMEYGWDWRAFAEEFIAKKKRIAKYFGVEDHFGIELKHDKYHEIVYKRPAR